MDKAGHRSQRAAVVGTGFMGRTHVEALRRIGVEVTGIAGSSPQKASDAARALGIACAYPDVAALFADPRVDAVHITSPNHLHFTMVKDALSAGKHVLCEKPLATNTRESAELVRLAAQSGRVTAVNYNIRFYPLCLEAAARVRQGALGPVHAIVGRYVQDWLLHRQDYNWRVQSTASGPLRAVADIGTHWLDLVTWITGLRVESLCADLSTVLPERERPRTSGETFAGRLDGPVETVRIDTEDQGGILLRFSGGARGQLWVSQMTAGRKNHLEFEIAGARAALHWESETPDRLWIGARDQANLLLCKDPALLAPSARAHTGYPGGHAEGFPDTFARLFSVFYDQIAHGENPSGTDSPCPLPTFSDGHRELQLCEAVLESHTRRCWVDLPLEVS